ncbi:hypothetical protein Dda_2925 [Drechslerella dactyloides]|uniref:Ribosomal RNA-processing protein 43 n=1 Tax=Drechslerella dactyloides TaxID=74499 RepID=A0AAD6NLA7_DREDA|nr:hypothetical protein Dda_2925 [Drechslerella dactyloides]
MEIAISASPQVAQKHLVGDNEPPPLTFPTSLFRHISPALYLQRHLLHDPPIRPNGRHPSQQRDFTLTTNSLSHAHGSAVVRTGDTAVVCGIRGEILTLAPGDDYAAFESYHHSQNPATYGCGSRGSGGASWGDLVVSNLEMSTGCSKKYPLGPPGSFAQTLSDQIQELIRVSKLIDLTSLRIYAQDETMESSRRPIKGYWSLYIDLLCISLDGNLLDAAWYAIVAALRSLKLPLAAWNPIEERIFCDRSSFHPISLRHNIPLVATFILVPVTRPPEDAGPEDPARHRDDIVLNDPDAFEEDEANETLTIMCTSINETEGKDTGSHETRVRVERIEKIGERKLGKPQLRECVDLATQKFAHFMKVLLREGLN